MGGRLPIDRAEESKAKDRSRFEGDKETFREKEAKLQREAREHDDVFEPQDPDLHVEREDADADAEESDDDDDDDDPRCHPPAG